MSTERVKRVGAETRKSREHWLDAALEEVAAGGIEALRIDVLAERLGVTKGSFYWHFRDRDDLVSAAIARWEERATSEIHALLDAVQPPADRLRRLVTMALAAESPANALLGALSRLEDPRARAAIERVTRARVEYLTGLYRRLGLGASEASMQALVAYTSYLGHLALPRDLRGGPRYASWLLARLAPPARRARTARRSTR
jgi:AcrR family transcriptional regulator